MFKSEASRCTHVGCGKTAKKISVFDSVVELL